MRAFFFFLVYTHARTHGIEHQTSPFENIYLLKKEGKKNKKQDGTYLSVKNLMDRPTKNMDLKLKHKHAQLRSEKTGQGISPS